MKARCLRKFVLMVSKIIHLAIQLNVVLVIIVKGQGTFSQNVILEFTLKFIMKM